MCWAAACPRWRACPRTWRSTRVRRIEGARIDEVVLAMNATLEGQRPRTSRRADRAFPVRVTQLAHGPPVGGELDYLDEGTLAQALRARRPVV
jgi:recombination protein RecR